MLCAVAKRAGSDTLCNALPLTLVNTLTSHPDTPHMEHCCTALAGPANTVKHRQCPVGDGFQVLRGWAPPCGHQVLYNQGDTGAPSVVCTYFLHLHAIVVRVIAAPAWCAAAATSRQSRPSPLRPRPPPAAGSRCAAPGAPAAPRPPPSPARPPCPRST